MRLIADFSGVVRTVIDHGMEGNELKIIRALEHELRIFLEAEPFYDDGSSTSDSVSTCSLDSYDDSDSEPE